MAQFNLEFNPDDYPDRKCCGIPEHLHTSGWVYPLVLVHTPKGTYWGIKFHQRDERMLRINENESATLMMAHCPFCGKELKNE